MERKLFGTDGIRGKANEWPMTGEVALKVGKALAKICRQNNHRAKIIIGKDTRLSGYLLETALTSGILSMGVDVYLVGPMPTPAIAHLVRSLNADAGIMLTASHNPAEDNGIKIFGSDAYKLSDEKELEIERLVLSGEIDRAHSNADQMGKALRIDDARGRYIEYAKHIIKGRSLNGLRIALDCANGSAYKTAYWMMKELEAEVYVMNNEPNGYNINRNCGALHPEVVQKMVLEKKLNAGIALDGDADRIIMCDENGEILDGDEIMAICALELKDRGKLDKNTLVATVMSNYGFEKAMNDHGIKVVRAAVGDRYVIEEMKKGGYSFGGEQSGHIIFGNYAPTGDGTLVALFILDLMKRRGKKLSELKQIMHKMPQVLVNVKVKEKKDLKTLSSVNSKIKEIEGKLAGNGRVLVRYSGTENLARVMLEGQGQKEIEGYANEIAAEIKKEIGA